MREVKCRLSHQVQNDVVSASNAEVTAGVVAMCGAVPDLQKCILGHPDVPGAAKPERNRARAADAVGRPQVGNVAAKSGQGPEESVGGREGGRGVQRPA